LTLDSRARRRPGDEQPERDEEQTGESDNLPANGLSAQQFHGIFEF